MENKMPHLFHIIFSVFLVSCAAAANPEGPNIKYGGAQQIQKKMIELFPDFKNANETRKLIEITIQSDIELIKYSIEKSTTLFAKVSKCHGDDHMAAVAFNSVFFHGKDLGFYLFNNRIPDTESLNIYEYKIYVNYDDYTEEIHGKMLDICIKVIGNSYGYKFESNKVKLPPLL